MKRHKYKNTQKLQLTGGDWPALLSSVVAPQLSDDQLPEAESSGQTVSHSSHSFAFLADFLRKKIDNN